MTVDREMASLFLLAPPSMSGGAAAAFDVFGTSLGWNDVLSETQADVIATRSDWRRVAADIRRAIAEYEAQHA